MYISVIGESAVVFYYNYVIKFVKEAGEVCNSTD